MLGRTSGCALLLGLFLSGCTEVPAVRAGLELDLITPGVWNIGGDTEHVLVWVQNLDSDATDVSLSVSFDDPAMAGSWTVTFDPPSLQLEPAGTKEQSGGRYEYPDWGWSLATLTVPSSNATWNSNAVAHVHAGAFNRTVQLTIQADRGSVTGPGDEVTAEYVGSYADNGEVFDDGSFPTELGSGQTVPGFDYGLMGLRLNESARLVVPPALGYGYDNTNPRYTAFNGRTLWFDVTIQSFTSVG